jgi:flagellar biosynthesis protein FliP
MALGMMMVPPASISLPLKILLFVLMDGWNLVVRALLGTFV